MANQSEINLSQLSDAERWRLGNHTAQETHHDHRSMTTEMVIILLITIFIAQIILIHWKRRHFRSYQRATLLGMWLVPIGLSLNLFWWRFCICWLVFSIITAFVTFKASRKPLSGSTPRWVYKWFLFLHKVSYAAGTLGYLVLLFTLFGLNYLVLVDAKTSVNFGLSLLFYGLYFGVVSRDFAEVCADIMASHIGYYSATGLPVRQLDSNTCAVCGNEIFKINDKIGVIEKTSKLTCGHTFHEFCIRGWCIVGKKQTCPYCKEKVDLKRMFPGPWERPHVMYGSLLDCIRYFVAWHPVISVLVHVIIWLFGLE